MMAGLMMVAIGAGGIKPCVSAHVGDQFGESNKHLLEPMFGWFYVAINVGAFTAYAALPVVLRHYGVGPAFAIPGIAMALATLAFWMGRHRFIHIPPAGAGYFKRAFTGQGLNIIGKLVPIYLIHRFQLIAVGKLIGGEEFNYVLRGDGQNITTPVSSDRQREAIAALINTLSPTVLGIPENVLRLIPPRPPGVPKTRETFPTSTGKIFEPFGAARSAAALTLAVMLEPSRAARLIASNARQTTMPGFSELTDDLLRSTWFASHQPGTDGEIQRQTNNLALERLMMLAMNTSADPQVRAIALDAINQLDNWLAPRATTENDPSWRAQYGFARFEIEQMRNDPSSVEQIEPVTIPPGEPIGSTDMGSTPDWLEFNNK